MKYTDTKYTFWEKIGEWGALVGAYAFFLSVIGWFIWSIVREWTSPQDALLYFASVFYHLAWIIAALATISLFGPARESVSRTWKIIWIIALLSAIICIIDSFGKRSDGHVEYSLHGSEWVGNDP